MPNTIPAAGEAMPKLPTINDLKADFSRLRSLLDVVDDLVGDITSEGMNDVRRLNLFRAIDVTSIAKDFAGNLDLQFDAYVAGRSK